MNSAKVMLALYAAAVSQLAAAAGDVASHDTEPSTKSYARIRTVTYDSDKVIVVPVAKGVLTHIVLVDGDTPQFQPGLGQGSDCKNEGDAWCVNAVGSHIFVKPRSGADTTPMDVVTSSRLYTFELRVLPPALARLAVLQMNVEVPPPPALPTLALDVPSGPVYPPPLSPQALIANRMRVLPQVRNTAYSVAVASSSEDIVPAMVFDDGTQTYFSFPNNRPLPSVFETAPDGTETMVNVRMQDDMVVADHVSRRFVLRMGQSVVAVINDKFDLDGRAPVNGTTIPGVARVLRSGLSSSATEIKQ